MRKTTFANDSWLDEIKLDDMDSEDFNMYGRKIPAAVILLAIASKTSPESIMKITKQLQPIMDELLKKK